MDEEEIRTSIPFFENGLFLKSNLRKTVENNVRGLGQKNGFHIYHNILEKQKEDDVSPEIWVTKELTPQQTVEIVLEWKTIFCPYLLGCLEALKKQKKLEKTPEDETGINVPNFGSLLRLTPTCVGKVDELTRLTCF